MPAAAARAAVGMADAPPREQRGRARLWRASRHYGLGNLEMPGARRSRIGPKGMSKWRNAAAQAAAPGVASEQMLVVANRDSPRSPMGSLASEGGLSNRNHSPPWASGVWAAATDAVAEPVMSLPPIRARQQQQPPG